MYHQNTICNGGNKLLKSVAQKSVNVEFSANGDSESDKENTPDVTGNEEYDFFLVLMTFIQTLKDLMRRKYCPLIPTLLPLKTGVMIKIQMELQMFSKKQL